MASTSLKPKERKDVVSEPLGGFILALDLAKGACPIPPAQLALGAASALLTAIKVRCFLFRGDDPPAHADLGHDGQPTRLPRARAIL